MGKRKDAQLTALFILSSTCAGYSVYNWNPDPGNVPARVMMSIVSLLSLDMLRLRPSDSHTVSTMFSQYSSILKMRVAWISFTCRWYTTSKNPAQAQEETLQRILQGNKSSEHGRKHHLDDFKSRADFVRGFQLTDYTHYKEYTERIANGEKNVLTGGEVIFLATTSGTTGKNKIYPLTRNLAKDVKWRLTEINSNQPDFFTLKRVHQFRLASIDRYSACGLRMGGAGVMSQYPATHNLVPMVYLKLYKEKQSYFAQALTMMAERELGLLLGYSSTLLYTFFKFIEKHWYELCEAIETGTIADRSIFDENTRQELESHLKGDPKRAHELRALVAEGIEGMAMRIWPDLTCVLMAKTGSFKHCADILMSTYLKGLKVIYTRHASTEAFIGLSIENENCGEVFTMMADLCFLEFIDISDADSENPKTYFMEELKKGKAYETVVTSPHGIYRFRLGDVVKVIGHYNSLPNYTFQYRLGERLNIAFERTPDQMVYRALRSCMVRLSEQLTMIDFTATESFNLDKVTGKRSVENQYIVYVEVLHTLQGNYALPDEFSYAVDNELQIIHQPYAMYRDKGNIAMLNVKQVRVDAFNALKLTMWGDHQHSQFKMPHVVRREDLLQVLCDHQM